jgi:hypothetical protein
MMHDPSTIGQTFDFPGPERISKSQIIEIVNKYTHTTRRVIHIPHSLKRLFADIYSRVIYWNHAGWNPDEVIREKINHTKSTVGPNGEPVKSWDDLVGMTPLEKLDGLITKQHMKLYLTGLEAVPHSKKKTAAERHREAEMNRIL